MGATLKKLSALASATALTGAVIFGLPAPQAVAQPPGFPDLNLFNEVDAAQFNRPFSYPERWANVYSFFRTPDGLNCAIGPGSWCNGNLPGLPAGQGDSCTSVHQKRSDQQFTFDTDDTACEPTKDKALNPGEKLTDWLTGTTCVVGYGNLTACINTKSDHGFVLQPSGSWVF
ncbi:MULTISPECIES: hypothetical protein [unclassified Mycolicibacterium]|uniref:hypothetical protein n=1 Tax=unclassified Mycolicibacterium TaxID=2636767 RepID=UPI0012DD6062|nr:MULTISPECIES: hypothetical protein [unclassified Mycolicibacterium]MUL85737.1 hypothetical protein [Mycolicibacterium sp. CBMA 329]MUL91614.1 hypothetical protein [Mycolicibacterium sp. CBMA 331]MUM02147.1 hypothetical protein [Mycolicibacterium sp. CBMA 334]MUM28833.1 hypothetical protein [Mycolicibacterium sp. CBMA 295]MUM41096.1 hypothetical protein [Mycolicibacterium sp. CBMA 247]